MAARTHAEGGSDTRPGVHVGADRIDHPRRVSSADGAVGSVPVASIVIVSWNGRQYLEPCLNAVSAQHGVDAETILVDNGSTDGSAAFVRERFPWVRLVTLGENRGFAGGNN